MQKRIMWKDSLSAYEKDLLILSQEFGGWENAHTHLDRSNTLDSKYWEHAGINPYEAATFSLKTKQSLTGELHKGIAYTEEDLRRRISAALQKMILLGTRKVTSLIDATPDIGLTAIETAIKVRDEFADRIDLKIGTQPIFGFKNPHKNTDRWEVFCEASKMADIIGSLPEKDDSATRIGFDEHLKMVIKLGIELGKEVHVHVDQGNDPREKGTETLIEAVRWLGSPVIENQAGPTVWAVHSISPSCYDEKRYKRMLEGLREYNIGVICCPRAAISMRQMRPLSAPIHNSIARILEMIKYCIPIRIGTDNIADVFIPTGSSNMLEELVFLADAVRYYDPKIWVKLGCGELLNDMDREKVSRALYQDRKTFREIDPGYLKI